MSHPDPDRRCPECGGPTSAVGETTLRSLLTDAAASSLEDARGFRFCPATGCETVYVQPATGRRFSKADVRVRVGQKESEPPRPVCYCFDHTAEEIEAEVLAHGTSRIAEQIAAKCRQGLQRCAETNPQGRCCLGNVRAVAEAAQLRQAGSSAPAASVALVGVSSTAARGSASGADGGARPAAGAGAGAEGLGGPEPAVASGRAGAACCAASAEGDVQDCSSDTSAAVPLVDEGGGAGPGTGELEDRSEAGSDADPARSVTPALAPAPTAVPARASAAAPLLGARGGALATAGAVLSAALSSACCWLPLLLVGLGVSASGLAGALEAYRPVLLVATAILLGLGFYQSYLRPKRCAPGEACAAPSPRLQRWNRILLWVATALAVAFAAFPQALSALLSSDGPATVETMQGTGPGTSLRPVRARVEGMTCEACAIHVREELARLPGATNARVDFARKEAVVLLPPQVDPASVRSAIERAGYRGELLSPGPAGPGESAGGSAEGAVRSPESPQKAPRDP
ncbi:MAG: hypothetical protein D6731_18040 [Planctomycetota bacterium]|nr:MAG: hypothetical protein D6731_18040 [Planctomycetota bacterium]